jgi:hypothetical protein
VTISPHPVKSIDENMDYFTLPEDTLYFTGEDKYEIFPRGDVGDKIAVTVI